MHLDWFGSFRINLMRRDWQINRQTTDWQTSRQTSSSLKAPFSHTCNDGLSIEDQEAQLSSSCDNYPGQTMLPSPTLSVAVTCDQPLVINGLYQSFFASPLTVVPLLLLVPQFGIIPGLFASSNSKDQSSFNVTGLKTHLFGLHALQSAQ